MYEVTVTQISTHRFLVEAGDADGAEAEALRRLDSGDGGDPHQLYREVENVSVSPYPAGGR